MGDQAGRRYPPRPRYRPMVFERFRKYGALFVDIIILAMVLYMIGWL